jgi:hypothetical protein
VHSFSASLHTQHVINNARYNAAISCAELSGTAFIRYGQIKCEQQVFYHRELVAGSRCTADINRRTRTRFTLSDLFRPQNLAVLIAVFCVVTSFDFIGGYQRFEGTCRLHLQGSVSIYKSTRRNPEDRVWHLHHWKNSSYSWSISLFAGLPYLDQRYHSSGPRAT